MGVKQIRPSIPLAPELALDEGTRGRLIERIRWIRHPCAREKITLRIIGTSHLRRKKQEEEEEKEQSMFYTLTHFSISFSLSLCRKRYEERENETQRW